MTEAELLAALAARTGLPPLPGPEWVERQRARLLQSVRTEFASRSRPRLLLRAALVGGLVLCSTAAAWSIAARVVDSGALSASVAGSTLAEGSWIETAARSEALSFSEGSLVQLSAESRARIARLSPERADITLESGKLRARITKHTGIAWTVTGGPYRVHVVGTKFEVAWDFALERFEVSVEEGRVRVLGGSLPASGVELTAGQSLLRVRQARGEAQARSQALAASLPESTSSALRVRPRTPRVVNVPSVPAPSWQQLARAGDYAKAHASAERLGLAGLLASSPADDLLLFANTARYAGDTRAAKATFLELRKRYPGHAAANLAAFSLGRLAIDAEQNPEEAVRWLRTFLRESPRGDLAAGARARLMNALVQSGDRAGAQAVARDYLRFHPDGPHRETARALGGSGKP